MKVKSLIPHTNVYGEKFQKLVGDEYEVPDSVAFAIIASDIVEEVLASKPSKKTEGEAPIV